MSGFGDDAFGQHPFGEAWWAESLWRLVPAEDRQMDETGDLRALVSTMTDGLNVVKREIASFQWLRDARHVRTRSTGTITIPIPSTALTEASSSDDGRSFVTISGLDSDLLAPISSAWRLDDGDTLFEIRGISKVTGSLSYYAESLPMASLLAVPPSLLHFLGLDFGVEVDPHEPELFQRSSVYDRHKIVDLRGSKTAIEYRAILAGFTATVYHLWSVAPSHVPLFAGRLIWEIPDGSGSWYAPEAICTQAFDAVPADMITMDEFFFGEEPVLFTGDLSDLSGSPGEWIATVSTSASSLAYLASGRWFFRQGSDLRFFIEPRDVTYDPDPWKAQVIIRTQTPPVEGSISWSLWPKDGCTSCGVTCPTHKLRVELDVADARLVEDPRALIDAFTRMVRKINAVLPAHVEIVQYAFTKSSSAAVEVSASSLVQTIVFDELFDETPADEIPMDAYTVTEH